MSSDGGREVFPFCSTWRGHGARACPLLILSCVQGGHYHACNLVHYEVLTAVDLRVNRFALHLSSFFCCLFSNTHLRFFIFYLSVIPRAPGALAAPGAVQPSTVSSLAPADLKQLATAAPVDAALVSSRGGARAPKEEPKKSQTVLVGIYFFLWCVFCFFQPPCVCYFWSVGCCCCSGRCREGCDLIVSSLRLASQPSVLVRLGVGVGGPAVRPCCPLVVGVECWDGWG